MADMGEPSRVREEEPQDIQVDTITAGHMVEPDVQIPSPDREGTPEVDPVEYVDVHPVTEQLVEAEPEESEPEEDEDYGSPIASPVRGGVMHPGSDNDDDDDDEDDEDPEEDQADNSSEEPAEQEQEGPMTDEGPAEYTDGMGTTAVDIIEELTTRNEELEDQIRYLEARNQTHQYTEQQYRDLAYQRVEEARELRQQLGLAEARAARLQTERDAARAELQSVRGELVLEGEIRGVIQDAWVRTTRRAEEMEEQVRRSAARVDAAGFALDTAIGRLRSRIRRFPREEDMSRQVISRRIVDRIARQEFEDAVRRIEP